MILNASVLLRDEEEQTQLKSEISRLGNQLLCLEGVREKLASAKTEVEKKGERGRN